MLRLNVVTNGVSTLLSSVAVADLTNGDTILLKGMGGTLEGWTNISGVWSKQTTANNTQYSSGYIGLLLPTAVSSNQRFLNFGGGDPSPRNVAPGIAGRGATW